MEEEKWRQFRDTNYDISNLGRIRNRKTMKTKKTQLNPGGYWYVSIYHNGEGKSYRLHRLVAEVWVENPHGYEYVNHIDEDRANPIASNLEWVTLSGNVQHSIHKLKRKVLVYLEGGTEPIGTFDCATDAATALNMSVSALRKNLRGITSALTGKDGTRYWIRYITPKSKRNPPLLAGEWRPIPNLPRYEVNTDGIIRIAKSKIPMHLQSDGKYLRVSLVTESGKQKSCIVHRLVAKTYLPSPPPERTFVNHRNGCGTDNRVENLEWVTPSENILHSFHVLNQKRSGEIAVEQLDKEGKVIKRFKSIQEASTATGVNRLCIGLVSRGIRKHAGNFGWRHTSATVQEENFLENESI